MTNHKKPIIDVIASLDRSCLSDTKEKTLKIDQSVKVA